jgi:hypothetical protein
LDLGPRVSWTSTARPQIGKKGKPGRHLAVDDVILRPALCLVALPGEHAEVVAIEGLGLAGAAVAGGLGELINILEGARFGLNRENSLMVQRGTLQDDAVVKMPQTCRSGAGDIDAIDYVEMFLDNEQQVDPAHLNDFYVLENFRPVVTKKNWRVDCGVAGYDNTFGLPAFFPTQLRCEDYICRLWVQQDGIAAAHVDAAQNHCKSN